MRRSQLVFAALQVLLLVAQTQLVHAGVGATAGVAIATPQEIALHVNDGDHKEHAGVHPDCCQASGLCSAIMPLIVSLQPLSGTDTAPVAVKESRYGELWQPKTPPPQRSA